MKSFTKPLPGVVLMALAGLSLSALAQPVPDLAGLAAATPAGDWSIKLWQLLFGDFANNPFSPGMPTTLMGNVFVIFNTSIFVIGFAWALWGIGSSVVQTAHEGEMLGRRMSTVWFPIRMVMGIAGMVPIFGGFTMYQAIMMTLTTIGIGIGNSVWLAGVNSTSNMQALINESHFVPTSATQVRNAVNGLFLSGVCVAAHIEEESVQSPPLTPDKLVRVNLYNERANRGYRFGSLDSPLICGSIDVKANARSGSTPLAYRSEGVSYDSIQASAQTVYEQGVSTLVTQIVGNNGLAHQWVLARKAANLAGAEPPPVPYEVLNALSDGFIRNTQAAITSYNVNGQALSQSARRNMTELGWFGAGAWYSTLAEANAAVADAAKGPTITTQRGMGSFGSAREAINEAIRGVRAAATAEQSDTGDGTRAILDSAIRDHCNAWGAASGAIGTATGNCSLGQSIVSAAIRSTAIGSGGGGNATTFSFDSAGLVNPIIMMKNMGDYIMTFSTTMLTAGVVMSALETVPGAKIIGGIADKVPGLGSVMSAASGAIAVLKVIAFVTLVLGAFMAIYIPLIPFITWMGAILAYAASVIEGLAGGSLHAMAHLDGDGDGLGQRTGHGYLFMVNVLARPALMLVGFFAASALMIAIGTLQAHMFLPAMANVQGNSMTGLFSIVAFLLIFFVMNVTLISASFNLIYVITDQVIGFVGGQINSHLGRDTEDKVNNVFMLAARVGPQAISQGGAALSAVNKNKAGGAGKGGGKGGSMEG